jgi:hypothetical protein
MHHLLLARGRSSGHQQQTGHAKREPAYMSQLSHPFSKFDEIFPNPG